MIRTLSQFNRASTVEAFDDDALRKEFLTSGDRALDALWSQPHYLLSDRWRLCAQLSRSTGFSHSDLIFALIERLPYVLHAGDGVSNGNAADLIRVCVEGHLFGDEYFAIKAALKPRLGPIVDVIEWHRRHIEFGDRYRQLSIFHVNSLATGLLAERARFGLEGAQRHAVQGLFDVLEYTLDGCHRDQASWFELHRYCASALGHDVLASKAYAPAQNLPELTARYKRVVATAVGQRLADLLFSNDRTELRILAHETPEDQRPALLLQLVKARRYYPSDVACHGNHDPWSKLCVSLCMATGWHELFGFATEESKKPLSPSDADMAALVKALAEDGCLDSKSILGRALQLCRTGSYSTTYEALSKYRDAKQPESPIDYSELNGWLARRMLLVRAIRFVRRLSS